MLLVTAISRCRHWRDAMSYNRDEDIATVGLAEENRRQVVPGGDGPCESRF